MVERVSSRNKELRARMKMCRASHVLSISLSNAHPINRHHSPLFNSANDISQHRYIIVATKVHIKQTIRTSLTRNNNKKTQKKEKIRAAATNHTAAHQKTDLQSLSNQSIQLKLKFKQYS
jgi:hypothetical protein